MACKQPRLCPVCAMVYKNQLLDNVKDWFADDVLRFMTVTMKAKVKGSPAELKAHRDYQNGRIMKCWNILRTDIERTYPGIRGWWMKEYTKRGYLHLHVLVNRFIDVWWLKRRWLEITGDSHQCWMEEAFEVKNAAAYMMKYMTKQLDSFGRFRKGERAYGYFGARAPAKKLLGFETKVVEVEVDPHFNPGSIYWHDLYYKPRFEKYGPVAVAYINWATLSVIDKAKVRAAEIELGYHDEPRISEVPVRCQGDASIRAGLLGHWRALQEARAANPEGERQRQQERFIKARLPLKGDYRPPSDFIEVRHPRRARRVDGGSRAGGPAGDPAVELPIGGRAPAGPDDPGAR